MTGGASHSRALGVAAVHDDDAPLRLRAPSREDGAAIHALIGQCPPLDLNSCYAYLLLAEHFAPTCLLAESPDGQLLGFISAYVPPQQPDVLFVWQVAVHERARGSGLALRMLDVLWRRHRGGPIRYVQTTVSPDNTASRALFARFARSHDAELVEMPLFSRQHFGPQAHEDEPLLRIGPLAAR